VLLARTSGYHALARNSGYYPASQQAATEDSFS